MKSVVLLSHVFVDCRSLEWPRLNFHLPCCSTNNQSQSNDTSVQDPFRVCENRNGDTSTPRKIGPSFHPPPPLFFSNFLFYELKFGFAFITHMIIIIPDDAPCSSLKPCNSRIPSPVDICHTNFRRIAGVRCLSLRYSHQPTRTPDERRCVCRQRICFNNKV